MTEERSRQMLSRMFNMLPLALAVVVVLSFTAGHSSAQSMAATLSGTVKDTTDASVPNAKITIANRATHDTKSLITNESGLFVAPDVDEGVYDISVEKQGFKIL